MTDERHGTKIEWMRDGVWTDITGDVAQVEIVRGLAYPGAEVRPATASARLNNHASLFGQDLAAFKAAHRIQSAIAVKVQVPASRWQAFKARLKRRRGFGWLPVRTKWVTRFTGPVDGWRGVAP